MKTRIDFQTELENILGSRNVYFQPPENVKIKYPCIIYNLGSIRSNYADNARYHNCVAYTVNYISKTVDDEVFLKLLNLEYSSFDRMYISDQLYHCVYEIYY